MSVLQVGPGICKVEAALFCFGAVAFDAVCLHDFDRWRNVIGRAYAGVNAEHAGRQYLREDLTRKTFDSCGVFIGRKETHVDCSRGHANDN